MAGAVCFTACILRGSFVSCSMNGSAFAPKIFSGSGRASPTNLRCNCVAFTGTVAGAAGADVDEISLACVSAADVTACGGFPFPDMEVAMACEANLQAKVARIMIANPINRKSRAEYGSRFDTTYSFVKRGESVGE